MEIYRSTNKINMVDNIINVLFIISQQIQQTTQQYDGNKILVSPKSQNFHEILKFLKSISVKYKLTLNENVPAHEVWSYIPSRSSLNGPNSVNRMISNKYIIRLVRWNEVGEIISNEIYFHVIMRDNYDIEVIFPHVQYNKLVKIEVQKQQQSKPEWIELNVRVNGILIGGSPYQVKIK